MLVPRASAVGVIRIQSNQLTLDLPRRAIFSVLASSASPIERAVLHFGTNGRTCQSAETTQVVEVEANTSVDLHWDWDLVQSGSLPLGAEIWWQWELHARAGESLLTDKRTLLVTDEQLKWKDASHANITLHWVEGNRAFGTALLDEAANSLQRLATDAGLRFEDPIQIFVYPSPDQIRNLILNAPEWTGGLAFPQYNASLMAIAPDQLDWSQEIIPHELAHLVTGVLTFNCNGVALPTWLDEGLSVYAEGPMKEADRATLEARVKDGTLPPLRSLANGFSAYSNAASLSYLQSGEVVRHLISVHGTERLATLLTTMRDGRTIDAALRQVYGFDTDELNAEWLVAWGGQAPTVSAASTPTPLAIPTLALWTAVPIKPTASATATPQPTTAPVVASPAHVEIPTPTVQPTPLGLSASSPQRDTSPMLMVGGGALLLVVIASIGWLFYRRR